MIQIMMTGWGVTRNSKCTKVIPITAEQNLRNQFSKSTADPVVEILRHFEKQAQENVTINHDKQGEEDTFMDRKSETQQSNIRNIL